MLLIDEIDRADDEFEAFLLEVLSDLPGQRPGDRHHLRRRRRRWWCSPPTAPGSCTTRCGGVCIYHWIGYPSAERELEIVLTQGAVQRRHALARKVVAAVHRLRELDLAKPPGSGRDDRLGRRRSGFLGETDLSAGAAADTIGAVIKDKDDLDLVLDQLEELTSGG